jgi:transcriptional regulator with XRE-family HTH domain
MHTTTSNALRIAPHTREDLPVLTAHNELIARVMQRHEIQSLDLAAESQLSESTICRILKGTRVVTPEVLRALYTLTQDNELINFLFGTKHYTLIKHEGSTLPKAQLECLAVRALSLVMSQTGIGGQTTETNQRRAIGIDEAITSLMSLRSKLVNATAPTSSNTRMPSLDVSA